MIDLPAICRELVRRGWWVTAAEKTNSSVIVGFNFFPRGDPSWLKAFELPYADATPDGVERAIDDWMFSVRQAIENGEPSATVRQMIAEHGIDNVRRVMRGRADA